MGQFHGQSLTHPFGGLCDGLAQLRGLREHFPAWRSAGDPDPPGPFATITPELTNPFTGLDVPFPTLLPTGMPTVIVPRTQTGTPRRLRSAGGAANTFRRMEEQPDSTPAEDTKGNSDRAIGRAFDILHAVAEQSPMLGSELAERVGLSTTTCYRITRALVARGLLVSTSRGGFSLGPRLGELAEGYERQRSGGVRN